MSVTIELARSDTPCRVESTNHQVSSAIWFKTKPLDRTFCHRATQLQLCADSHDQGTGNSTTTKIGSWFEVVIFSDAEATKPRTKDGKELAWRSHKNALGSSTESRHFGAIFDRRQNLLDDLQVGNVVAVRLCAEGAGMVNDAMRGHLVAKLVTEDLFSHNSWTLSSFEADIPTSIENGVYTLTSTSECQIKANDSDTPSSISSRIWFSTQALDANVISKIQEIQLHTESHDQGFVEHPDAGSWSWFDIVILESPEASTPKQAKDGRFLIWLSHTNPAGKGKSEYAQHGGYIFDRNHHPDLMNSLEVGNVIAIRVCAQFPGWENHAHSGRLVVRISNTGSIPRATKSNVNWEDISRRSETLKTHLDTFLNNSTPSGADPALSLASQVLSEPLRADMDYGAGKPPLRLLSLDGGGVRGISSLEVLGRIMAQVSSDPNAKPCDYFDMMAGTSTGGLIAIMLGRLRMSVPECIKAYYKLAEDIFSGTIAEKVWLTGTTGARYSGETLEKAIKGVVKDKLGNEDAGMLDSDPKTNGCKVFVATCRADNLSNKIATQLRTYVNPEISDSFSDCKIWQAGRATSAAPTYFPRMKIGEWDYVDGGLGFNNPVILLLVEAATCFGRARPVGCLVTLGTGMAPNVDLGPQGSGITGNAATLVRFVEAVTDLTTSGETTNILAESFVVPKDAYYRFNVGVKLYEKLIDQVHHVAAENWADIDIALDDYKDMKSFVALTDKYLEGQIARVAQCASKVTKSA